MRFFILILIPILTGCAGGQQFAAYQQNLQADQNNADRQERYDTRTSNADMYTVWQQEQTKRAGINAGNSKQQKKINTGYQLPAICTEESAKVPEADELCEALKELAAEIENTHGPPADITIPSGANNFNGATIYGGIVINAPGATAEGAQKPEKQKKRPMVPVARKVPESDLQTVVKEFFGFGNNAVNKISDNAGLIGLGWGLVESVKNPGNYVGGNTIGGSDNTGQDNSIRYPMMEPEGETE